MPAAKKESKSKSAKATKSKGTKKKTTKSTSKSSGMLTTRQWYESSFENECARKYYIACLHPFDVEARGACVPSWPTRPSQKATSLVSGTFQCGTTGFGFVACAPCSGNGIAGIYHSKSSYAETNINIMNGSALRAGVEQVSFSGLPYVYSQFDRSAGYEASVRSRIVSCGVRIRYVGRADAMNGRIVGYVSPDHANQNTKNFADVANLVGAKRDGVTREWRQISAMANAVNELEYGGLPYNNNVGGFDTMLYNNFSSGNQIDDTNSVRGGIPMVFMIDATADDIFEFEAIVHCEYVGSATVAAATPNKSSRKGLEETQQTHAEETGKHHFTTPPSAPRKKQK